MNPTNANTKPLHSNPTMTTPRPILKTHSSLECFPSPSKALPFTFLHSPHVHFPPTPTLSVVQTTHSPYVYDRAPIVVSPNTCRLPARGGRVYNAFSVSAPSSPTAGSYFHSRPFEVCEPEHITEPTMLPLAFPGLMPDLSSSSSESEDSDAPISPFRVAHDAPITLGVETDAAHPLTPTACPPAEALAFLPHPHTQAVAKGRPKPKRKATGWNRRTHPSLDATETFGDDRENLSLDGCLGGF
ncbi:hypothetical protein H0H81_008699 [Sphagnurus paluster]|uniref:Uncharacterized protein n=1 Tax=Sphagnurus paluster TaxID=117069 RepID=A0A9P7FXA1_9AGAR|nr:hypothetical protein H0H81_008699 [Sphagnurus paluster]